jgi:hypothetical protein
MKGFEIYGKTHKDGDAMLMIRNNNTCRALFKTPDHWYADYMRTKIEDEIASSSNRVDVLLRYYRLAYQRNIYMTTVA